MREKRCRRSHLDVLLGSLMHAADAAPHHHRGGVQDDAFTQVCVTDERLTSRELQRVEMASMREKRCRRSPCPAR